MNIFQRIATFIARLMAVFCVVYGLYMTIATVFIMPASIVMRGMGFGVFCLISGGILFFISKPLGKFIGKDLDN